MVSKSPHPLITAEELNGALRAKNLLLLSLVPAAPIALGLLLLRSFASPELLLERGPLLVGLAIGLIALSLFVTVLAHRNYSRKLEPIRLKINAALDAAGLHRKLFGAAIAVNRRSVVVKIQGDLYTKSLVFELGDHSSKEVIFELPREFQTY